MLLDDHTHRSIIDFMRAIGIILVIAFHVVVGLGSLLETAQLPQYIDALPGFFNISWQALGSELIFLFSGFLLSYLLLRELRLDGQLKFRRFYLKRASRIVPLYLLALVLYSFVARFTPFEFLLNMLFVSKLFGAETIVPVGWSLEVLVQSFVLLPPLTLLLTRSRHPVIITLAGIGGCLAARYAALLADPASYQLLIPEILAGAETTETLDDLYYHLGYRATPFLLGFLMAYLVVEKEAAVSRLFAGRWFSLPALAGGLLLVGCSGFLPVHDAGSRLYDYAGDNFWLWYWTAQRFVFALGVCLLSLCLWYRGSGLMRLVNRLAGLRTWKSVSENIYSIYLFHPVFLIPAAVIGFRSYRADEIAPINFLEVLSVIILATIFSTLAGRLLTRYIETPARDWIRARYVD
jgi:peptidoglycan/LPS O-acetylase OafA/YrhL